MIPDSLMITEGSGLITALEDQRDLLRRRTQGMEARVPDVLYGPQQCGRLWRNMVLLDQQELQH
ncbi:hypothetical protein DNTS_033458 [Danionella cerebrum]|uniref:Uncharacterized protein n=1 Tax=Danionella cerebrum TaxID=2873325 RepID=A0A553NHI1_9TELE|nr:hypothetical protein DNTS_033458 [Danionella translucida]